MLNALLITASHVAKLFDAHSRNTVEDIKLLKATLDKARQAPNQYDRITVLDALGYSAKEK